MQRYRKAINMALLGFTALCGAFVVFAVISAAFADTINKRQGKIAAPAKVEQPATVEIWPPASKATGMPGGFYIGGSALYGVASTELETGFGSFDGVSSQGVLGKAHAGYDYRFKDSPWMLGVWVAHYAGKIDNDLGSIAPKYEAGGKLGYVLPSNTMVFVGGHWKRSELEINGLGTQEVDGLGLDAGVEFPVLSHVSLVLGWSGTRYEKVTVTSGLDVRTDEHVFGGAINFRF